MITHKEMVEVYKERDYGLNAAEINQSVKDDREIIHFCGRKEVLKSKEAYHGWLDEMERLGGETEEN